MGMANANLPAPKHINLAHQYGCAATMTVVYIVIFGIPHCLRRFWREDMPESGKVEMYTLCPGTVNPNAFDEQWLGYADPTTRHGAMAIVAMRAAREARSADELGADMSARYAMMEMN